jgi:hypothetical protein
MLISLLLLLAGAQEPLPASSPITVSNVSFEPADLTVSWDRVVAQDVTYIETQIAWRFSDGTSIVEQVDDDWFLGLNGFGLCCEQAVNLVYGSTPIGPSLLFSTPNVPVIHGIRKPKTSPPPGAVLVDADVTIVAVMMSDGTGFGDSATLREVVNNWQRLDREYAYWLTVIADAWQDDSAIATQRTFAPLVQPPRRGALGEKVRLQMKMAVDRMLPFAETHLDFAPWLLEGMVRSIEQQRGWLLKQLRSNPLTLQSGIRLAL